MDEPAKAPPLELTTSRNFLSWLGEQHLSFAFTTYQTNRLFLIGRKPDGRLGGFERLFDRPMGLYTGPDAQRLYMSSRYQLWRFENVLDPGQAHKDHDRLYVPRVGHTTGDIDCHDVVVDRDGRLLFVNTLFSCLATLSDRHGFKPLWRPPFISRLAAEDRCHLNGLAMVDGLPRYVTAVSRTDVNNGWREHRHDGGCVVDIDSNEIIATGLSMPHSPRWHNGRLWLLNSGSGEFGSIDPASGKFEPLTFLPGYGRGLAFIGDYALVGLSKPRDKSFSGLALDQRLAKEQVSARCGVQVIDLNSGDVVHWLQLDGIVSELYDVQTLPGVAYPMALGFKSDEIAQIITSDPE